MISTIRRCSLMVFIPPALAAAAVFLCPPETGQGQPAQQCTGVHHISWPAVNPVWSLCWIAPNASSGVDGSGLELRHVFYKGKRVFWRAHVPVLNVHYDSGLSYRDWANQLAPFEADNVITPGLYAEPKLAIKTVCDHPGTDGGTFSGVALTKTADHFTLTTQMAAGWYRYIQTWTFYKNGVIEPRFAFTAVNNPHVTMPHNHHVYWRFDFDIDGFANDVIEQLDPSTKAWKPITIESSRKRDAKHQIHWRVRDKGKNNGYEVIPGSKDDSVPADAWGVSDIWALHYHANEIDDGGATGGTTGDAAHLNKYLNKENIDGQDVVLWYRAGFRHVSQPGHVGCGTVGPKLVPFGAW